MKGLIIVAGIPYSGKSTLCRELQKINPEKFPFIDADQLFDDLMDDPKMFFDFLLKAEPKLYWSTKEFYAKVGILDPRKQIDAMRVFGEQYGVSQYVKNMENYVVAACAFEKIANLPHESCPVIEGLHTTREARQGFYERMRLYPAIAKLGIKEGETDETPTKGDIDSMRKFMVYFDLGARLSLKRLKRRKGKPKYKSLTTKKSNITKHYEMQELPLGDEIPNLEILVVKSQADIDYAIRTVSSAYI